ncbi:hypothetical protein [Halapricum salinum]|uniref:hypothetical protein n=1 Tax=Halapricum salinum TaxID=1457250 RepID=UPI0010A419F4|nr:hypothetical protein [Halapricum salinum]
MKQYISYQLTGVVSFLVVSIIAFAASGVFGSGYTAGLVFGFAIGLAVALFEYGVVVETEVRSSGYPDAIKRKIDQVFE